MLNPYLPVNHQNIDDINTDDIEEENAPMGMFNLEKFLDEKISEEARELHPQQQ